MSWVDVSVTKSPHASTLDMTDEQKERAREREARIESEGFGFARALGSPEPRRSKLLARLGRRRRV